MLRKVSNNTKRIMTRFLTIRLASARRKIDLVTVSVLLDAGAGADWKYVDEKGEVHVRSEGELEFKIFSLDPKPNRRPGLAIASFDMFAAGLFSSDKALPNRVNSLGLKNLQVNDIVKAFQVSKTNPLGTSDQFVCCVHAPPLIPIS